MKSFLSSGACCPPRCQLGLGCPVGAGETRGQWGVVSHGGSRPQGVLEKEVRQRLLSRLHYFCRFMALMEPMISHKPRSFP